MSQSSKLSLTFAATIVLYVAVSLVLGFLPEGVEIPIYMNLLLSQALIVIPASFYMKKNGKDIRKIVNGRHLSGWTVVCLVVFIFVSEPLIVFFNYVSSLIFGNAVADLSEEMLYMPMLTNILFVAVMPAISEETVFRGIYYQGYRKHGFWKAALVSGLFFGLMHMNWNQFSYGFILGILFAFIVEATGNVRASMIVHFGINFESVMALNTLKSMFGEDTLNEILTTAEQSTEVQTMAGMDLLYGSYLFLAAAISAGLCVLLIWLIAKTSKRSDYMGWVLWGGERRHLQSIEKEPLFDRYLLIAILIPVAVMCLLLLLQSFV